MTGIAPLAWNIENGTAFSSGIIFCFYAGQSIAPLRKFFVIYQPFCDRPALLCLANRCTVSLFSFVVVPSMFRSFFPSIFFFFYRKYFRSKISPRFSTGEAFPYRQSSNDLQCCSINRKHISTIRLDVFSSVLRKKKWLKKPLVTSDKLSKKGCINIKTKVYYIKNFLSSCGEQSILPSCLKF